MKLITKVGSSYGRRCFSCTAYITKSKKHGIPSSVQKTWKVYCDLAEPSEEMRVLFKQEAERWRAGWMARWYPSKSNPIMVQTEIA